MGFQNRTPRIDTKSLSRSRLHAVTTHWNYAIGVAVRSAYLAGVGTAEIAEITKLDHAHIIEIVGNVAPDTDQERLPF